MYNFLLYAYVVAIKTEHTPFILKKLSFTRKYILSEKPGAINSKELKKISTKETKILIKYPDYEYFYKNFFEKKNKSKFMKITNNNFSHYLPLWKNYNVDDNVENRVSMMFCDYSNIYFKDQYTLNFLENINDKAYHGPAIISKKKLNKISIHPKN